MFKSNIFRQFVKQLNTGSLIQHMFTSQMADFAFPLAPSLEQEQIAKEVESRLSVLEQLEAIEKKSLKRVARLRQSILTNAFSGKLVPAISDTRMIESNATKVKENCQTGHAQ